MKDLLVKKKWARPLAIGLICLGLFLILISVRQILAPIFIALAIGYVGDPIIDRFEKWKIARTWGIVILIAILCLILFGLGAYIIPKLITQIEYLAEKLPAYWAQLRDQYLPTMTDYAAENPDKVNELRETVINWLKDNSGTLIAGVTSGLKASFQSIGAFLANILSLVIIPVLAFYFLRDFDIMKEKAVRLIPLKRKEMVVGICTDMDRALGNFIKGQLLVALILSVIYSIGLAIAGCPAWLLIGVMAGFSNLIPYLGIALGLLPAVLLTYLSGNPMWQVIVAGLTFVVGQMMEGMVITPKIVGESVGLHPVVVLLALMVGGTYFGFVGMILALPVSAVLFVLLERGYHYYISSVLYHEGEPEDPVVPQS